MGIDLSTLKRWMRLPEFIAEYWRARWEVGEQAYARVQQNTPAAASVLLKLMVDPATPASGRIRAALGSFGLAREALDPSGLNAGETERFLREHGAATTRF